MANKSNNTENKDAGVVKSPVEETAVKPKTTTAAKTATAKSATAKPAAAKTATAKSSTAKTAAVKAEEVKPEETKTEEITETALPEEVKAQTEAEVKAEQTAAAIAPTESVQGVPAQTDDTVVSAKDSTTDQTVSAVNSDSAIFDRQGLNVDIDKERKKQKTLHILKTVFVYIFLTLCAVLAFLPFYWMIISSVKTEMEFRETTPTFFPHSFKWANYSSVLNQSSGSTGSFWQILINTLTVGLISTTIGVVVTIVTAYALARMKFKGKNMLFGIMMATMMIPGEMYTITNYLTVSNWHWNNSFTVLILPFLVSVYYIYLLRNNFMQIPNSLYQAAKVDGLSDMGYLLKVMVPLTAPTLISITLLKFIGTWNSYIWPRLVNAPNWQMITNWVTRGFVDRGGSLYNGYYSPSEPLSTLKMAAVCLVSLPLFILFIFCRKYIMHGVSKSGTKG